MPKEQPQQLNLLGYFNPLGFYPTFLLPVFGDESQMWVQEVDDNEIVTRFSPYELLDLNDDELIPCQGSRQVTIGEPALHVFMVADDHIIIGSMQELARALKPLVSRFSDRPHLQSELTGFIKKAESRSKR